MSHSDLVRGVRLRFLLNPFKTAKGTGRDLTYLSPISSWIMFFFYVAETAIWYHKRKKAHSHFLSLHERQFFKGWIVLYQTEIVEDVLIHSSSGSSISADTAPALVWSCVCIPDVRHMAATGTWPNYYVHAIQVLVQTSEGQMWLHLRRWMQASGEDWQVQLHGWPQFGGCHVMWCDGAYMTSMHHVNHASWGGHIKGIENDWLYDCRGKSLLTRFPPLFKIPQTRCNLPV